MDYALAQVGLPGISNINPAEIIVGLTVALQWIFVIGLLGGVTFIIMRKKWFVRFPTTMIIEKMWGGEPVSSIDHIRRVKKKNGDIYYEFKKRPGFKWRPPSFEMIKYIEGKSVIYAKELAENEFQVVDPKSLFSASSEEYKRVEGEEMDKLYKNLQDVAARQKWKQESSWKKLLDALPLIISIMGVALFFYIFGQYVAIPMINQYSGAFSTAVVINNQSQALLDKSTAYVELLLRQSGGTQTITQYVCSNHTIVNNPNLC